MVDKRRAGLGAIVLSAFLVVFWSLPAAAQQNMRSYGSISFQPEPIREQIGTFSIRQGEDLFRSLQIESVGGSAQVIELRLVYRNSGTVERIRMGDRLKPGTLTNIVRSNDPRPLRQIDVVYLPSGPVTLVLRAEPRRSEPPAPTLTWTQLGCKSVGFFVDIDRVSVTDGNLYRALRLRSSGFDIEMRDMTVVFSNGQRDVYRINTRIPSGGFTSPIDLRGERRRIREIELLYNTSVISNRKTQLCVEGLKESR
jgi:hypothetical protein